MTSFSTVSDIVDISSTTDYLKRKKTIRSLSKTFTIGKSGDFQQTVNTAITNLKHGDKSAKRRNKYKQKYKENASKSKSKSRSPKKSKKSKSKHHKKIKKHIIRHSDNLDDIEWNKYLLNNSSSINTHNIYNLNDNRQNISFKYELVRYVQSFNSNNPWYSADLNSKQFNQKEMEKEMILLNNFVKFSKDITNEIYLENRINNICNSMDIISDNDDDYNYEYDDDNDCDSVNNDPDADYDYDYGRLQIKFDNDNDVECEYSWEKCKYSTPQHELNSLTHIVNNIDYNVDIIEEEEEKEKHNLKYIDLDIFTDDYISSMIKNINLNDYNIDDIIGSGFNTKYVNKQNQMQTNANSIQTAHNSNQSSSLKISLTQSTTIKVVEPTPKLDKKSPSQQTTSLLFDYNSYFNGTSAHSLIIGAVETPKCLHKTSINSIQSSGSFIQFNDDYYESENDESDWFSSYDDDDQEDSYKD